MWHWASDVCADSYCHGIRRCNPSILCVTIVYYFTLRDGKMKPLQAIGKEMILDSLFAWRNYYCNVNFNKPRARFFMPTRTQCLPRAITLLWLLVFFLRWRAYYDRRSPRSVSTYCLVNAQDSNLTKLRQKN